MEELLCQAHHSTKIRLAMGIVVEKILRASDPFSEASTERLRQHGVTRNQLVTVLTKVEAVNNSRPIPYGFSDSRNPQPKTPAHSITVNQLTSVPCPTSLDVGHLNIPILITSGQ
ncbi:hypothetical protein HPB48_011076 [Haemaphysalis longicornis]|uniref:Uncharacterized protein n=1 Tax=Haemaphysalis longicornis TaxID=44386 RepID=A0A9J6GYN1_HAELO|nr:hypothetical protein HPB48_011076 [Haemaphysalis longicornis]